MTEPRAMPQPGDPAPEIEAEVTGNGHFSLAAQRGRWVVVYFFPRANTPG
jgi:thioredoxin-dependent peroxiredoxin